MFNGGIRFIAFSLMLWAFSKLPTLISPTDSSILATIVGYRQFPTDKVITDDKYFKGTNFRWIRVVSFNDPSTGQPVSMNSNPAVANPEPIGTKLEVLFNSRKLNPLTDDVSIKGGMRRAYSLALITFVIGLVLYITLLFIPQTSILDVLLIFPAFAAMFISYNLIERNHPNQ